MTITSFLFGSTPTRVSLADTLVLDAAVSVTPSRVAKLTKNPVESGGDIADHAKLENLRLQIDGFVSEAPISTIASLVNLGAGIIGTQVGGQFGSGFAGAATAGVALASNALLSAALSPDIPPGASLATIIKLRNPFDKDYPKKCWDYLLGIQQDREPFSVVTAFKRYSNMVITNLSSPQISGNGGSLRFTATLEQIQIVNSQTIQLSESDIAANAAGASSAADLGKQAASGSDAANNSILFDFFGGAF